MVNVIQDTPTPNLGLRMQPSQKNRGIWGDYLNDVLLKVDEVFSTTVLTVTGGNHIIEKLDYEEDEATPLVIELAGNLVSPQVLTFPQSNRAYFITNKTTGAFSVTVTTGSGTPRIIPQGGTTGIKFRGNLIDIITQPVSADGVSLGTSQFADINVTGHAEMGSATVQGALAVLGGMNVNGTATFGSMNGVTLSLTGAISADGANFNGQTVMDQLAANTGIFTGDVQVQGNTVMAGSLQADDAVFTGNGNFAGNVTISGTLNIGALAITNLTVNNMTVSSLLTAAAANLTTLNVLGSATLSSDPVNALEAATKQYVDAIASGIQWKASVKVATTVNIALTGTQTIDGVGVVATDRVLVKNQTNPVENGIYVVSAGAWTRSSDADTDGEINGMVCFVTSGTTQGGQTWIIATSPATIAGPKTYVLFSSNVAQVSWALRQW